MSQRILELDLPEQLAPSIPKPSRCKFCRSTIPLEDEGATAWRICEDCWPHVCFVGDL